MGDLIHSIDWFKNKIGKTINKYVYSYSMLGTKFFNFEKEILLTENNYMYLCSSQSLECVRYSYTSPIIELL
jgi:hypothetical protein